MKKIICMSLVFLLLAAMVCSCSNKELEILPGKRMEFAYNKSDYSMMSADWPYYNTPEKLAEASDYIYIGKVKNISFDIMDIKTGLSDCNPNSTSTSRMLDTIYTIEIVKVFKGKGEEKDITFIDVNGGIPGYQETEQYQLLNNSQLSQKISRIPVVEDHSPLVIDETYLFCVVDFGGQYPVVVNADQFAMSTSCSFAKEVIRIAPET
mgnify:CR=1 FL=1